MSPKSSAVTTRTTLGAAANCRSSRTRRAALRIATWPVRRQMLPSSVWEMSASDASASRSSRAWHAITNPGVQKATPNCTLFDEGALDIAEPVGTTNPFDGGQCAAGHLDRQCHARAARLAVEENGAAAAHRHLAGALRARQSEIVTDGIEEQVVRRHRELRRLAVDRVSISVGIPAC